MQDKDSKIDCTQCQHYFVTWESDRPHGCRFFGFKSPQSPALVVIESSRLACHGFQRKMQITQAAKNKTNKDDKSSGWVA